MQHIMRTAGDKDIGHNSHSSGVCALERFIEPAKAACQAE